MIGRRPSVAGLHLAYGGLLVGPVAGRLEPGDRRLVTGARVLGVRHLLQGLAVLAAPSLVTGRRSAAVGVAHALSMVALAAGMPRHRGAATVSALVDGVLAVVDGRARRPAAALMRPARRARSRIG